MEEIYNIEYELAFLEEAESALDLLLDELEHETRQRPEEVNEAAALCFVRRIPLFLAAFRVVSRDINTRIAAMNNSVNAAYAANRAG